ncbi:MAG TPA: threonine/serine dehydratase [Arenicellales bacterium]|jgi:threonine dehydratase|nr:serine/threonine dehydratase [Acidiferrobacteraceae bacterium]MDP6650957.1 threonine/serine dehydratase [Gammaproteobacteria bacterium]MDP7220071.1 threonine/serine dehydratase [Arenicellales bacterium]HCF75158.1 serine/threonine dehydratase [Gammaproteobacteria bacterium]HJP11471.1 threonine/serine dehydratase [Arenicellales bacterium]|tara:strand:- start:17382 stop:18341 length:960 start_codon:yes stop_codon:yes gene_type:complete
MNIESIPSSAVLATERIRSHIRETPLEHSPYFSTLTGANVWLKLENLQTTGSFKLRGACNKLLSLSRDGAAAGCVAASSGNHGAAVAYTMNKLGIKGVIFVPEWASSAKVDAIRRVGAEVQHFGTDGLDTEQHARQYALDNEMTYVSPYNDADVIVGQASCGVEITKQIDSVDALFVAVGGGGLIAGVAGFLKSVNPSMQVIGCQPTAAPIMAASIKARRLLDMPSEKTLSDGTAGAIEAGAITFDLCQKLVDDYALVSEEEIALAMREFIDAHHMLLEGAAGVALAGLKQFSEHYRGQNVVVIICGANINRDTLRKII